MYRHHYGRKRSWLTKLRERFFSRANFSYGSNPRLYRQIFGVFVAILLTGFVTFAVLVLAFSRDLPSSSNLQRKSGFSTTFVDRNGKVLYELYKDKNLIPVSIDKIPLKLQQAIIAIEDKDFYSHPGFSISGILRGAIRTVFFGRTQGGSTITQQLVKNSLLSTQRSLVRKVKEFVLSVEIERRYTKKQILELYLNETPFGGSYWGVGSAARGYFDKDISQLTVLESAILAGLPQSPTRYSPCSGKELYKDRTKNVLRRMREDGYLKKDEETQLLDQLNSFSIKKCNIAISAPHFVFFSREEMENKFGEDIFAQGVTIKTSIDFELQDKMQKIVFEEIEKVKKLNATNGALVAIDPKTGHILAMVGSYDYFDKNYGEYNTATALRQPGSLVKPITYALGMEKGYTASSVLMDVPTEFVPTGATEAYNPVNYDGKYRGPVQLRFALGNSLNIPAVKMLANVSVKSFLQKANSMGLTQFEPNEKNLKRFGLSITLGGGETRLLDMTNAFAVFAREGNYQKYSSLLEISDYSGKVIYKNPEEKKSQVFSPEISYIISHILSDNNARLEAFGSNSLLNIKGKTVAVKTGTTNDKRDNWAVGYTKDIVIGVWVGNNDNSVMNANIASGTTGASSIWNAAMREALSTFDYKDGIASIPEGVEALEVDSLLGGLPKSGQGTRSEYFVKGTTPTDISIMYKKVKLSRSDNQKLASASEIKSGSFDEKDFVVLQESDPVSSDGKNRFQDAINAWVDSQENSIYKVPRVTSENNSSNDTSSDDLIINSPSHQSNLSGSKITLEASVNSNKTVESIAIYFNGSEKKLIPGNNKHIKEEFELPKGSYEIKVIAKISDNGTKTLEKIVKVGLNQNYNDANPASPTNP